MANGPDDAAGQASVITGEAASGARAVVFGTSVFFRTHPKGGMSQAARALYWAGPEGDGVRATKAPSRTKLAVQKLGKAKRKVKATVTLVVPGMAPNGTVSLKNRGEVVRTFKVTSADGKRSVKVRLGKGKHVLRAVLQGTAKVESSRSKRVRVTLR